MNHVVQSCILCEKDRDVPGPSAEQSANRGFTTPRTVLWNRDSNPVFLVLRDPCPESVRCFKQPREI